MELLFYFHANSGLLGDSAGGMSSTGLWTANLCLFYIEQSASWPGDSEGFRGSSIGVVDIMEKNSFDCGGEDDAGREREVISVIGSLDRFGGGR